MNNKQRTPRSRVLSFENLENRELLSVNPVVAAALEATSLDRTALLGRANVDSNYPGPIQFTLPPENDSYSFSNAVVEGGYTLAQPKITSSSSTTKTITVEWTDPNDPLAHAVAGYAVYYNKTTEKNNVQSVESESGQTSVTINDLDPSASYYVRVVANGDGITTSDSPDKSYKTIKTQALRALVQPTVTVTSKTTRTIGFEWSENDDAVSYDVMYRKSTDKTFTIENVDKTETSMTLDNLDPNATYYLKVVAKGDNVNTKDSAATKYKTAKTVALQKLTQPTITVADKGTRTITASWDEVKDAAGYEFLYRESSEKTYETYKGVINDFAEGKKSVTLEGLEPNTTYYFKVVAKAQEGDDIYVDSDATKYKTAKTKPIPALAQPKITSLASDIHTIDVAWTEDEALKPERYEVQYRKSSEKTYTTYEGEIKGASATINGLDANSTYYVRVIAKGDGYDTLDSKTNLYKTVKTKPLVKLVAPTITSVQTTDESLTVNWTADDNVASVAVVCKRAGTNQTQTIIVDHRETHYTIDNLVQGGKYYVHVVSYGDHITTDDSPNSAVNTVSLAKSPKTAAPTILGGTTTEETVGFNWKKVEGAVGYEISYGVVGGDNPAVISVAESEDHYTIKGLAPQTPYYVQVRALGAEGIANSDYCPPVKFTTEEKERLATPTNFQANVGATTVDLKWRAVENATGGYTISYGEVGSVSPTTINVDSSKTSYQISGLQSEREYVITLCANGDESVVPSLPAEVCVRTGVKLAKPNIGTSSTYPVDYKRDITVQWNAVEHDSGYYEVWYQRQDREPTTTIVQGTSYKIEGASSLVTYRVKVRALSDPNVPVPDYLTSEWSDIKEIQ